MTPPNAPRRGRPNRTTRWARVAGAVMILGYAAWCAVLYAGQDAMLFPREIPNAHVPRTSPAGVRSMLVATPGGFSVEAWYLPHPGSDPDRPSPTVFFFHGNAELIDDCMSTVRRYHERGFNVVLPEYRGYGRSGGVPSQAGIVEDMVCVYDLVTGAEPRVDPTRIVFHGRSLGGGVAAQVAAQRAPTALILESTFTSVASFASGYGVPAFLVTSPFRTDRALPGLKSDVLILHGARDTIVPESHGRALSALRPDATFVELRGGHMDLEASDPVAYWRAIDAVLEKVRR